MTLLADRHQLVASLCLVTQCLADSAYGFAIPPMANLTLSRGRASMTVHSKAEPGNEVLARWRSARSVEIIFRASNAARTTAAFGAVLGAGAE